MAQTPNNRHLLLVNARDTPARRPAGAPKLRRYRLARIRLDGRATGSDRFAHLRRSYD